MQPLFDALNVLDFRLAALVLQMDDDISFLPPNHPLRVYLRSLNLDDDAGIDDPAAVAFDNATCNSTAPVVEYASIFDLLHYFNRRLFYLPKKYLLDQLLMSQDIFANDRIYLDEYRYILSRQQSINLQFPMAFASIALVILPLVLLFLFSILNGLLRLIGTLFLLLMVLRLASMYLAVFLTKRAVQGMEILHMSFKKSIVFLRGLTVAEMGYVFATRGGPGPVKLSRLVLPNYSRILRDGITNFLSDISSLSLTINHIIETSDSLSSSLLKIGSSSYVCRPYSADEASTDKNKMDNRTIFRTILEIDSELARIFGCFFALHCHDSVLVNLRIFQALLIWLWCLCRVKRCFRNLHQIRTNLELGNAFSDELLPTVAEKPNLTVEDVRWKEHLSALTSLQYILISWSRRVKELRDKIANRQASSLLDVAAADVEIMRILQINSQQCMDEVERTLQYEPRVVASKSVSPTRTGPEVEMEVGEEPIPLDSQQDPVEYECLEAVVGDEDLKINEDLSCYDDLDLLGQPFSREEMKKRNADRAILLTELNSVIARRMIETRDLEEKALSRGKKTFNLKQSLSSSPATPLSTNASNSHSTSVHGGYATGEGEGPSACRADLKRLTLLRANNFPLLVKPLDSVISQSQMDNVDGVEADHKVSEMPSNQVSRPSPIPTDLRALILQRGHVLKMSGEEETFDLAGTGAKEDN